MAVVRERQVEAQERADAAQESAPSSAVERGLPPGVRNRNQPQKPTGGPLKGRKGSVMDALQIFGGL